MSTKEYYQKNREEILQKNKSYRLKNKDKLKTWREENRDRLRQYNREYYQKNREEQRKRCRKDKRNRREEWKLVLKEHYGELKCQLCGYDKNFAALDGHHRNPEEKDIAFSRLFILKPTPERIAELDKCDLLCKNCHTELHHP